MVGGGCFGMQSKLFHNFDDVENYHQFSVQHFLSRHIRTRGPILMINLLPEFRPIMQYIITIDAKLINSKMNSNWIANRIFVWKFSSTNFHWVILLKPEMAIVPNVIYQTTFCIQLIEFQRINCEDTMDKQKKTYLKVVVLEGQPRNKVLMIFHRCSEAKKNRKKKSHGVDFFHTRELGMRRFSLFISIPNS